MSPTTSFTKNDAIPADSTFDPANVKGKSVVITGGASGIGEACMRAFVQNGAFVTFGDVAVEQGQALEKEFGEENVRFVRCDVMHWNEQLQLFKTALSCSPAKTIDIVFANAGIAVRDQVYQQDAVTASGDPEEPDLSTLKINLIGVAYTVKLAMFYLPKQPDGPGRDRCILLTSSIAGYLDHPGRPQYNAAKSGVRGLLKSLRQTGPKEGIRVNLLAPWVINTRIVPASAKAKLDAVGIPLAEVKSAADAAMHIACDSTINGRALIICPRVWDPRGYYDLKRDDWDEGDFLTELQNISTGFGMKRNTEETKS